MIFSQLSGYYTHLVRKYTSIGSDTMPDMKYHLTNLGTTLGISYLLVGSGTILNIGYLY